MKNGCVAVILCGCGSMDGSEIHESVMTMLAIDNAGTFKRLHIIHALIMKYSNIKNIMGFLKCQLKLSVVTSSYEIN